jgi:hypothetical protein
MAFTHAWVYIHTVQAIIPKVVGSISTVVRGQAYFSSLHGVDIHSE